MKSSTIVISVGGSLIVPNSGIDVVFLKDLKKLIKKHIARGIRFIIVTGGGATARQYQTAAKQTIKLSNKEADWIGIHATRLNGNLVHSILRDISYSELITDPTASISKWKKPVLIAAGWKPGWSTDYVATRLAKRFSAKTVINLSNIDYLCDKDPRKYKDAKAISKINWKNYRAIVGNKWNPGMNVPFDPIASKLAQTERIEVIVLNGKNIKNLNAFLLGKDFKGTTIEP